MVSSSDDNLSFPQLLASDTLDSLQGIAEEYRKTFAGTVIGITGSCGKTSTKDILGILLGSEVTHCTSGNLNNHLGVPLSLLGIELNQHKFAVIEAGINGKGEMQDLAKMIQPNIVLVTNIGSSHLAGLGDEAGVASEKAELLIHIQNCKRLFSLNNAWSIKSLLTFTRNHPLCVMFYEMGILLKRITLVTLTMNFGLKQTRPGTHRRSGFGEMGSRL